MAAPAAPTAPTPPRSRTIPQRLHAATLARLGEVDPDTARPHTCKSVARWLAEAHGCPASSCAVRRLRATAEKHTSAQVTAALREEIAEAVPAILARMKRASKRLDERVRVETNTQKLAAALNACTRAAHELAALGGVAAPVQVDVTSGGAPIADVRITLATQLARLAGGSVPDEEGGAGSEPDGG